VDEGIRPGERVVVEGFSRVKSGSPVTPKEAPEAAAESVVTPPAVAQAGR